MLSWSSSSMHTDRCLIHLPPSNTWTHKRTVGSLPQLSKESTMKTMSAIQLPHITDSKVGMIGLLEKSTRQLDLLAVMKMRSSTTHSHIHLSLLIIMFNGKTDFGLKTRSTHSLRCLRLTHSLRISKTFSDNLLSAVQCFRDISILGVTIDGEPP